ncbi:MAG: Gfo/Idh/MocA family oxidoreductase [Armatimonadetes bacterium]|nr:Gfo/Idh/MocA family oxidoreductase [Armatimonadota bacterium]
MAASARFTASVVGGGAGGQLSLSALQASARFDLAAAADLMPEARRNLEEKYPGLQVFENHRDMFAACPTDIVCVSTYPPTHEEVALDALKLPLKGILVEKPLGHTAASGRCILAAIRERRLPMAVPHGLLAKRTSLEIIERVQAGEIGELKLVEIQCAGWDIINAGIHWLNFFVMLSGCEPVDWVMALCDAGTRTYRDGMQVETVAVTYAQTRSGVRVVMHTGDEIKINREGKSFLFRLVGTGGQIEFWGWENGYLLLNARHPEGRLIIPDEYPITGHRRHLENMAAMIDSGVPDYTVPESSLMALELCEGAYLSSRHRCQVRLPLEGFAPPAPSDWDPGIPYSGQGGGRDGRRL